MTFQFANLNGTNIHYEIRGTGTAVVLIHAGIVNLHMWDPQMDAFTKQHRVLRYDVRGWGETARPDTPYSNHDDLHDLMQHVGLQKAALVGASWGGKIALDFALTYPGKVEKLVLVGPGLGGYDWTDKDLTAREEAVETAYDQGRKTEAAELETQIWFDGPRRTPDQVDQAARRQAYDMIVHTFTLPEGQGERRDIDPPAIARLAEITAPTLVIVGAEDVPDIQAIAQIVQQTIPAARQVTMADTAHLPNMEKPAEFNQIVLSALAEKEMAHGG